MYKRIAVLLLLFGAAALHTKAQTNMQTNYLTPRQQDIAVVAAFAAQGDMAGLKPALHRSLDDSLTVNEIKQVLVQMYAYCGFPRSLNALGAFMEVIGEREKAGLPCPPGKEATPLPAGTDMLQRGTEVQTELVGAPVKGGIMDFAPDIDLYLKAHLFGDIFARDNLDHVSREIATVGALSALTGAESQLRAHLHIARNTGLTSEQLHEIASVLKTRVGAQTGNRTEEALKEIEGTPAGK